MCRFPLCQFNMLTGEGLWSLTSRHWQHVLWVLWVAGPDHTWAHQAKCLCQVVQLVLWWISDLVRPDSMAFVDRAAED